MIIARCSSEVTLTTVDSVLMIILVTFISALTSFSIRKLRGPSLSWTHVIDMLPMGVYTTRHCQTSGRLVQELNVCTVAIYTLHTIGL